MKVNDIITGGAFALLGAFMLVYARELQPPRHLQYGAGFFPTLIGSGLMLVGAGIAWGGVRASAGGRMLQLPDASAPGSWLRFAAIPIAILFYLVAADTLGFLLTATVILTFLFAAAGVRLRAGLPISVVVSLVFTAFFASLLHMPLPWGPLRDISGWLIW
jgi:putative tricarboxylic transport membrane protein